MQATVAFKAVALQRMGEGLHIRIDGWKRRMKHRLESSSAPAKAQSRMRDRNGLRENVLLALKRVSREAAGAENAEQALWTVTRTLPSLLGNWSGDQRLGEPASAAAAFMATPDGQHHLITAPVNFRPEQYHELVAIDLGHPGTAAAHPARDLSRRHELPRELC
jgi:hypothetical protein